MATKHEREINELKAELADLSAQLKAISSDVAEEGASEARARLEEFRDQLDDMMERGKERARYVGEKTREAAAHADEYAKDHPWTVAAAATALGVLVGALVSRRNRD
jgi:ElaB/YqjD/DUF883 family membrane-anchored ribosome-binding protein